MPKKNRNNIWSRKDFRDYTYGKKNKVAATIKYVVRNLKYSKQRITRGFCDKDMWEMYFFLQKLIPDMLENMKENRNGSPVFLKEGEDYDSVDEEAYEKEWDEILNRMIFLWRQSDEEICAKKNPYEDEYGEAFEEFSKKYGLFGEKLQTKEEIEEEKKTHTQRMHFMTDCSARMNAAGSRVSSPHQMRL